MRNKIEENELTLEIVKVDSWINLKSIIKENAPFISHSRMTPKEWSEELLLRNIEAIRRGNTIRLITRANGLRAKVAELVLAQNYGDPWE